MKLYATNPVAENVLNNKREKRILYYSRPVALVRGATSAVNSTEISRPVSETASSKAQFSSHAKPVALRTKIREWERKHGHILGKRDALNVKLNGTVVTIGRLKLHGSYSAVSRLRHEGRTYFYHEYVGKTDLH